MYHRITDRVLQQLRVYFSDVLNHIPNHWWSLTMRGGGLFLCTKSLMYWITDGSLTLIGDGFFLHTESLMYQITDRVSQWLGVDFSDVPNHWCTESLIEFNNDLGWIFQMYHVYGITDGVLQCLGVEFHWWNSTMFEGGFLWCSVSLLMLIWLDIVLRWLLIIVWWVFITCLAVVLSCSVSETDLLSPWLGILQGWEAHCWSYRSS